VFDVTDAVIARGLVKHYKDVKALDGLDLRVPEGSVLGVLGPNGAGKTTAVKILTTLVKPDGGQAVVAGLDVTTDPQGVRRNIGVSGQYAAVDEQIAVADVGLRRPTLDDVFLALTGHSANAAQPGPAETPTRPTQGATR